MIRAESRGDCNWDFVTLCLLYKHAGRARGGGCAAARLARAPTTTRVGGAEHRRHVVTLTLTLTLTLNLTLTLTLTLTLPLPLPLPLTLTLTLTLTS